MDLERAEEATLSEISQIGEELRGALEREAVGRGRNLIDHCVVVVNAAPRWNWRWNLPGNWPAFVS